MLIELCSLYMRAFQILTFILAVSIGAFALAESPCDKVLIWGEAGLPTKAAANFRLLTTQQMKQLELITGDRLVVHMINDLEELEGEASGFLTPEGKKKILGFVHGDRIDEAIAKMVRRFSPDPDKPISHEVVQRLLAIDGHRWIRKMFQERNAGHWDEVIRIYDDELRGPNQQTGERSWQDVAEAKLQAALALNRRNGRGDRTRAFKYTDEVIAQNKGQNILSEAYGIRARIYKDMWQESKSTANYRDGGNPELLEYAIQTYEMGFRANSLDYYPGSAALDLLYSRRYPDDIERYERLAEGVRLAVKATLQRYERKGDPPDFWVLSTAMTLAVRARDFREVSRIVPKLIANSAGKMNLETVLQTLERLKYQWMKTVDSPGDREEITELHDLIKMVRRAMENPQLGIALSENSPSYVATEKFPDMEAVFNTRPISLGRALLDSGVATDLHGARKKGEVNIQSFHEFLRERAAQEKADDGGFADPDQRPVLLAPTGAFKSVIQAVADRTGLAPWWEAYHQEGVGLSPENAGQLLRALLKKKRPIYFFIHKDFARDDVTNHTLAEFKKLIGMYEDLTDQVTFVFGLDQVFPLNFEDRIAEDEVASKYPQYRDGIMRLFLRTFQKWLVGLGGNVKHYTFSEEFKNSLYPLIYNRVVMSLRVHREMRELHYKYLPQGAEGDPAKILDIGAGTGALASESRFLKHHRDWEIFDRSEEMLNVALDQGLSKENVHVADATDLRRRSGELVEDNSVDGIVSSNMAYLMSEEDLVNVMAQAHRILKPGGVFTISSMANVSPELHKTVVQNIVKEVEEMFTYGDVSSMASEIVKEVNQRLLEGAPTLYTGQQIIEMCEKLGMEAISKGETTYDGAGFFVACQKRK